MSWFTVDEEKTQTKLIPKGTKLGRRLQKGERPANAVIITKETSMLMHRRRLELAAERAREGQRRSAEKHYERIRKGESPGRITDYDAWELANEKLADVFYGSDSAKSVSDTFATMGRATGMLGERDEKHEQNIGTPDADLESARALYQIIINVKNGKVPEPQEIIDAVTND